MPSIITLLISPIYLYFMYRYKDGKEVHADAHIKITRDSHRTESYSMTLNLVKAADTGEYEVKASNTMGTVSSKTYVHVYSKYRIDIMDKK